MVVAELLKWGAPRVVVSVCVSTQMRSGMKNHCPGNQVLVLAVLFMEWGNNIMTTDDAYHFLEMFAGVGNVSRLGEHIQRDPAAV